MRQPRSPRIDSCCLITALILAAQFVPGYLTADEIDTDRWGSDYKNFEPASANPNECAKECVKDKNTCKAFTYVKPTATKKNGVCYLKKSIPTARYNTCCISKVVRRDVCVHGNSGQFQDKKVDSSNYGWGVDYNVVGSGSWIQYSIPTTENENTLEAIWIKFTIQTPEFGWIEAIHIWDGDRIVQKFDNQVYGISLTPNAPAKTTDMLLPLTTQSKVGRGVGVSIRPASKQVPGLAKIVNMEFHGVCARYLVSP